MFRTINAILVCTSIAALIGVYGLKYAVEDTASEKVRIERHIDRQESELSLLQADWAYLNQPAHVAPIVARHAEALGLLPTKPQQFGSITDLPMRPIVQVDDSGLDGLFQSL
ncbi:MAG TPA: hypothetical protein PK286_09265, partial [Devosia sp.]|nr:hypothetical protein [Devosia sp.]